MGAVRAARMLRPSVASLGYALFLAMNAAGVWGGVFPFLPLEFQTSRIVLWFFLAQSLAFALCFCANAVLAYWTPRFSRWFAVKLTTASYLAGWCCLIAATYLDALAPPLVAVGGALLGWGSAEFYTLWQRLFASRDASAGNRELIVGTVYAAPIYFALYLIPVAITAFLIPLVFLPLFGLAIVLKSREIDLDQPMFADVPRDHPAVYRRVVRSVWRSAFCLGALGFCAGIMRSLAVAEPQIGTLVNVLSMAVMAVAALVLLVVWYRGGLHLNVVSTYRVFFPFVITAFFVLPFAGGGYIRWLAAALYALYSVAIVLMMIQCAQTSRDSGINPVFVYGIFGGAVYALHDLGFIAGTVSEEVGLSSGLSSLPPLALVALVAVYLLGVMYFVGQGGFRRALDADEAVENIELLVPHPPRATRSVRAGAPGATGAPDAPAAEVPGAMGVVGAMGAASARTPSDDATPQYRDRISKQVEALRRRFGLSIREAQVMECMARGFSVARVAEELVVSENTVRTHQKRIYAKLDVHKKQELLDLIEAFTPGEL